MLIVGLGFALRDFATRKLIFGGLVIAPISGASADGGSAC